MYILNLRVPTDVIDTADRVTDHMAKSGVRNEAGAKLKRADVLRRAIVRGLAALATDGAAESEL